MTTPLHHALEQLQRTLAAPTSGAADAVILAVHGEPLHSLASDALEADEPLEPALAVALRRYGERLSEAARRLPLSHAADLDRAVSELRTKLPSARTDEAMPLLRAVLQALLVAAAAARCGRFDAAALEVLGARAEAAAKAIAVAAARSSEVAAELLEEIGADPARPALWSWLDVLAAESTAPLELDLAHSLAHDSDAEARFARALAILEAEGPPPIANDLVVHLTRPAAVIVRAAAADLSFSSDAAAAGEVAYHANGLEIRVLERVIAGETSVLDVRIVATGDVADLRTPDAVRVLDERGSALPVYEPELDARRWYGTLTGAGLVRIEVPSANATCTLRVRRPE